VTRRRTGRVAVALAALSIIGIAGPAARAEGPPSVAASDAAGPALGRISPRNGAGHAPKAGTNLTYHKGPVMRTNKVYLIFWEPTGYTVSANYDSLITQYFTDVTADSGKTTNVYYSTTQYSDTSGAIAYSSTVGGTWQDTSALPASGCTDTATTVCLSDAQIQAEVQKAMAANGWTASPTTMFYVFTAKSIGSCAGSSCAFTQYCAYHSRIGNGTSAILYANMPYAMSASGACSAGQSPNSDEADATINVTSHEHAETITDPQGSAWYDSTGAENGDKCAWNFGTATGSTAFGSYNQTINGHRYYLQQEWSNATSKCVLTGK